MSEDRFGYDKIDWSQGEPAREWKAERPARMVIEALSRELYGPASEEEGWVGQCGGHMVGIGGYGWTPGILMSLMFTHPNWDFRALPCGCIQHRTNGKPAGWEGFLEKEHPNRPVLKD